MIERNVNPPPTAKAEANNCVLAQIENLANKAKVNQEKLDGVNARNAARATDTREKETTKDQSSSTVGPSKVVST